MNRRGVVALLAALAAGTALLCTMSRPASDPPSTPAAPPAAERPPAVPSPSPPSPDVPATVPAATASVAVPRPTLAPHDQVDAPEAELAPAQAEAAAAAAGRFAAEWLTPDATWHQRLSPLSTTSLSETLAHADPPPPGRALAGPATVLLGSPQWAQVAVPTSHGDLVLDLVLTGGDWRVSAIDWWPA